MVIKEPRKPKIFIPKSYFPYMSCAVPIKLQNANIYSILYGCGSTVDISQIETYEYKLAKEAILENLYIYAFHTLELEQQGKKIQYNSVSKVFFNCFL